MRLKNQNLIALGLMSTIVFSGCTASSGGFLNLGVADALRKSSAGIFKKRLHYTKTPLGNTGLSLPTFGTQPAVASGPVEIDSYTVQQNVPAPAQVTPAPSNTGGSCGCSEDTAVSIEQFYMPGQQYVAEQELSNEVIAQPSAEVVMPPVETIAPPIETVPNSLPAANPLPKANLLPANNGNSEIENNKNDTFEKFDTEGTLEPLGQNEEKGEDFELDRQEEIADGQREDDQSIFEQAELTKRSQIRFDSATSSSRPGNATAKEEPTMLTLHARPAQSHNVFNQAVGTQKTAETVQASHKPYYRQLNALRQQPTKLNDHSYRQARNTTGEIEFKPLPPVSQTQPVQELTPKMKMMPLQESDTNRGTQNDDTQNDDTQNRNTRTANATGNQMVKTTPRVPILRATTVSSASILSLKNLANVIEDTQSQNRFYGKNSHTAQGITSSSVDVLDSDEATIER